MAPPPVSWLKHWHPHFRDNFFKWLYISDHLEGRVLDGAELEHLPKAAQIAIRELVAQAGMQRSLSYSGQVFVTPPVKLIEQYLLGRRQAEHDEAYRERKALADYTPHFLSAVITLAGMIFAVEQDAERSWGELGDPRDPNTPIGALWGDADGRGTSYPAVFRRATVELIAFRETWGRVEGTEFDGDRVVAPPTISTVQALLVEDFFETDNPTEVKTWHHADTRSSIREAPVSEKRWWVYYLDRAELWREKDKKGTLTPELLDTVFYGGTDEKRFIFKSRSSNRPVLPIFREQLSIPGNVGWLMAKKANAIFNMENANDFSLWVATFVKLLGDVKDADGVFDETLWNELKNTLQSGANLLPGIGHRYIAPPLDGATIRLNVIEQKVKRFYHSFFQSFADQASIERSATESRQGFRADIEAFLTILTSSLDDLENGMLYRLEQITFPDNPELWGLAFVERSRKFVPVDWPDKIDQLVDRTMPGGAKARIPLDAEMLLDIAVRWLKEHGIAITPEVKERLLPLYEELAKRDVEKREESDLNGGGL